MGDWKYLKFHETEFLFNVETDEHKHVNLIAEHPGKAKELKAKLAQWGSEMKHPGLAMEGSPVVPQWLTHYFYESLPKK